jgi:hypothetical protein
MQFFLESKGVFKDRLKKSFSIFYWIKTIIFFPKNTLLYLGVGVDSIVIKFAQVVLGCLKATSRAEFSCPGFGPH